MPLAPFRASPSSALGESRRTRLALAAALLGITAAVLAYAISPGVRHAVKHAVARVFRDHDVRQAPPLTGQVLFGPRADLSTLRGHRALIVFWSESCAGCVSQAPAVAELAHSRDGRGRVLAVQYAGDPASGRRFIKRYRWSFPNLRDDTGQLTHAFGIHDPTRELPVAFLLDPTGGILRTLRGPQTVSSLQNALLGKT
ncbi:MAG TPA: TlpA disulfide reductase family protein [Solirubrobacteraceae bacterium]|jgi:peroxiredoxin